MRQFYLQREFYQLSKHPPVKVSAIAKAREHHLAVWEALQQQGMSTEAASHVVRISRATLYRWKKRFREQGWAGLEPGSRRPKQVRKNRWRAEVVEEVQSLRILYPCWGKEKIKVLMAIDGIEVSISTVGRIIRYLKERNAIPHVPYRKRWKGKRQTKRPHAIRKPKGYAVTLPGDIVQVDTLDLHPFPGVHFKHFTARDVVSRWDVVEVYPKASARQAKAFLHTLLERFPSKPKAIQVDGGSEFMAEFEEACAEHGIALFVLPPRSPKLNGRVERAHRTHLDEFYAVHEPEGDLQSLNRALRCWEWVYNNVRPHRALDNLTPKQYIEFVTKSDPQLSHLY
jgi:transposase InsO family protein